MTNTNPKHTPKELKLLRALAESIIAYDGENEPPLDEWEDLARAALANTEDK